MAKALFLDRDGTLIVDKHYLFDPEEVELLPGVSQALRIALDRKYLLFLFTNQSGVGRGYFKLQNATACNQRTEELIGLQSPLFQQICAPTESPSENQVYRKPSPRFIEQMVVKYNLDKQKCFMIGDTTADAMAAVNAGIHAVGVCTGKLNREDWATAKIPGISVFDCLLDFARTLA